MAIFKRLKRWSRKKRTRRLLSFIFIKGGIVVVTIVVLWFLIHTPLFSVRHVTVTVDTDNRAVVQKIETLIHERFNTQWLGLVGGRTYYLFRTDAIVDYILAEVPQIAHITITSELLHNWHILAHEREPFASYCYKPDDCLVIDVMGVPFSTSSVNQLRMLETDFDVTVLQPVLPKVFEIIVAVTQFLEEQGVYINRIAVSEGDQVVLETTTGLEIRFSTNKTIYETTRSLYVALFEIFTKETLERLQYLDVRQPDTIHYIEKE